MVVVARPVEAKKTGFRSAGWGSHCEELFDKIDFGENLNQKGRRDTKVNTINPLLLVGSLYERLINIQYEIAKTIGAALRENWRTRN